MAVLVCPWRKEFIGFLSRAHTGHLEGAARKGLR